MMKIVFLFLVALSLGQSTRAQNCTATVNSCMGLWGGSLPNPLTLNLNLHCGILTQFTSCIGDCVSQLRPGISQDPGFALLEYSCDPSRRALVERVMQADCLNTNFYVAQLPLFMRECFATALRTPQLFQTAPCAVFTSLTQCIGRRVGQICGAFMVPVYTDVAGILTRYSTDVFRQC